MAVVMHQETRRGVNRLLDVLHVGGRETKSPLDQYRPHRTRDLLPNVEGLVVHAHSRLGIEP